MTPSPTADDGIALARALEPSGLQVYVTDWTRIAELADREGLWEEERLNAWLSASGDRLSFDLADRLELVYASPALRRTWEANDLAAANSAFLGAIRRLAPRLAEHALRAFCLGGKLPPFRAVADDGDSVVRPQWLHGPSRQAPYAVTLLVDLDRSETSLYDLRRSEARYRAIIEDHPDFIVRYRPDGVRTFVNEAYADFFGGSREDFVGTDFFALVAPQHRAEVEDKIRRLAEREADVLVDEHLSRRHDGVLRWTQWIDRALFDTDDNLVEFQSVGRDVTDRREAEERRLEVERRLAQAQKMEAVGTLASGLAHDFNNTLTGILAFAHGIQARPDDPTHVADCASGILEATGRAAELTHALLDVGRQREAEKLEDCDLDSIVRSAGHLLRSATPSRIAVEVSVGRIPPIRGDAGRLTQALVNLGLNARDAIEGRGRIEIRAELSWPDDEPTIVLRVRDDGTGIPEDIRSRIFEPFYTTKAEGRGSGLGLAMVYGCALAHGGRVDVESEPGSGATFEIRFPFVPAQAPGPSSEGGTESLLLVDDEPMILLLAREILEDAGYTVRTAESRAQALDLGARGQGELDLVITDHLMPDGTGADLVAELRLHRPDLPSILLTGGLVDRETTSFHAVVTKPFSSERLLRAVRETLDRA